jgi:hypothetical protein
VRLWLVWWTVLAALWLLLTEKTQTSYLVAGAIAAAIGASAGLLLARWGLWTPVMRWDALRPLSRLPLQIVRDTFLVLGALARRFRHSDSPSGSIREISFETGGGDARSAARRALIVFGLCISPNTCVVGLDRVHGTLLVHQLVPTPQPPGHGDREWPL